MVVCAMPKQINVFLNSPYVKSALVDVPDSTSLVSWIADLKVREYFIGKDDQLWLASAVCGAELIETIVAKSAVEAMREMSANARR